MHAPWAMALAARLRDTLDVQAQSLWSDDGIALHFPDSDAPPPLSTSSSTPGEIEDLVLAELGQSALFGALPRERLARAPHPPPPSRSAHALWQQRLKAQSLLQVARRYPQFPIVAETYRECLQDVFDLLCAARDPEGDPDPRAGPRRGRDGVRVPVRVVALFDYVSTYMYEDDTPPEERRAQALARPRPPPGADGRRGAPASCSTPARSGRSSRPRSSSCRGTPTSLHDSAPRAGPLLDGEHDAGFAETLLRERRAFRARMRGGEASRRRRRCGPPA